MFILIIIILGCSVDELLYDRLNTAKNYLKSIDFNNYMLKWYLAGGTKYFLSDNESSKMFKFLNLDIKDTIIESKSKNTAENFLYLNEYLKRINYNDSHYNLTVITSRFHSDRANKFANEILNFKIDNWIYADKSCKTCWNDEKIHIKNIDIDIQNAKKNMEL